MTVLALFLAHLFGGDETLLGESELEVGLAAGGARREAQGDLDPDDLGIPRDGLVV